MLCDSFVEVWCSFIMRIIVLGISFLHPHSGVLGYADDGSDSFVGERSDSSDGLHYLWCDFCVGVLLNLPAVVVLPCLFCSSS
jgi:hypothetical protein